MKKDFLLLCVTAWVLSCTNDLEYKSAMINAPIISAMTETNYDNTKTSLSVNSEGIGTVLWNPHDEINVFYGASGAVKTTYTSQNTENVAATEFTTNNSIDEAAASSKNIWGLYPSQYDATCDGKNVFSSIPTFQEGVGETFNRNLFISLAHSENTEMTFYNVCGGIKFSLSRDDIKSITFCGNNDEDIVGYISLTMDSYNRPVAEVIKGNKSITLTSYGNKFKKDVNYYIIMLPTVFTKGFTMIFNTESQTGTFTYSKAVEIKRSVFSKKNHIDTFATFDHSYVDLGLSVKWATCNIGANRPQDYGSYFAWGEVSEKENYDWESYLYCNNSSTSLTKYCVNSSNGYNGYTDNLTTLELCDDAAHYTRGGKWRMPTVAEWQELFDNCSFTWVEEYGGVRVKGYVITNHEQHIFLPAAGYCQGSDLMDSGETGHYWSSSLRDDKFASGWDVNKNLWETYKYYGISSITYYRYKGLSIRPVHE